MIDIGMEEGSMKERKMRKFEEFRLRKMEEEEKRK